MKTILNIRSVRKPRASALLKPVEPMLADPGVVPPWPVWSYSGRTAILKRDGIVFAVVTPDGRQPLGREGAEYLLLHLNRTGPSRNPPS